jgi:hypothetical protein
MCQYMCALLTFLLLMTLPVCSFQTTPETAKQAASAGDQEKPRFEVISIRPGSSKPTSSGAYAADVKFLPGGNSLRSILI